MKVPMDEWNTLWVCWKDPDTLPGNDVVILSFLSPQEEEELKAKFTGRIIPAREIAQEVKDRARKIYVDLIARIGATPAKDGKTLRQELKINDGVSLWWFHKVSEKDCEGDFTFDSIVEVLVVISVTGASDDKRIVLFDGCKETADVLRGLYKVEEVRCRRKYKFGYVFVRGGFRRIKYFFAFLVKWLAIKITIKNPETFFDVVFSGFWDWSIKEAKKTDRLDDLYFKSLPALLSSNGLETGWFLWFDPYGGPISKGRKLRSVLEPIRRYANLVFLQYFVKVGDLIKAVLNFKPYLRFLHFCRANEFRRAFTVDGIDFFPLLRAQLSHGFLDSTIPHLELVYVSSVRAFKKYRPKVALSFLELFLYSRAFYAGGRQGCQDTVHCAIQHASYSREKTFVLLHPEIEYTGYPDGCPVPKPDYVFAMGELGKEIFMEDGFPEERVFLTGSPRYEHIRIQDNHKRSKVDAINLLIVTSLGINLEIEMVEAVCTAAKGLKAIKLLLRSHPFAKIEEHPRFRFFRAQIESTNRSLEEDLEQTDLVVVTYSTVGEEALLRGIPVWQWLTGSYNGSVFRDIKVVPSFYSVSDLREALKKFVSDPASFVPKEEIKRDVLRKCFFKDDGNSTARIARICHDILRGVGS